MTHPAIEIASVWEDADLLEVAIRAGNRRFAGEARCCTTRDELRKLSAAIGRFPKYADDEVRFSTHAGAHLSYFSLHFRCVEGAAHVAVRVRIAELGHHANVYPITDLAEFDVMADPAAIETFSGALSALAGAGIGGMPAVLHARPGL